MRRIIIAALLALLPALAAQAQAPAPAPQPPPLREATIVNETDRTIQELYLSTPGAPEGADRLGTGVLAPRASQRIPLGRTRDCGFEMRVVFEDGDELRRRVDVCRSPRVAVQDTGPRREVEVANDTDTELRELYLFAPGTENRGRDRLGSNTVAAGARFTLRLRGTQECVFDVRAVFVDDAVETRERVDLCRTPRLAFGDASLPVREQMVANRGQRVIREFYARPVGRQPWGADRLGSDTLAAGAEFRLRLRTRDCAFDLRAVFEDNREEVQSNQDVCTASGFAFGGAPAGPARTLSLTNEYPRIIQQVFLSDTAAQDWGADALGSEVLAPGATQEVRMEGGCRADLRIVFDTSAAEERRDIDICANPSIALRPGWVIEEFTPAAAAPASGGFIRLRNATRLPVVELYADPAGAARGADRLGAGVLGAGEVMEFQAPQDLPPASRCLADLTAVFRDGRELRLPATGLCDGAEVVLQ